ncbi:MAG: MFS transporter [Alphaproteobacteria bacterium]|nr:MFS transporter [Alphaproteobacteria bacterium]
MSASSAQLDNTNAAGELGWLGVVRIGLVQMSLGAIVILTTSTLNRVMVVELAMPAAIPGALVGWHYAVQMSRPRWGYGADIGGARAPWIIGGIATLAAGAVLAAVAAALAESNVAAGLTLAVAAFTIIGVGVGAAGTNALALLAARTPPARKAAAAAIVWIMMIFGFVLTAGVAGVFLDPFSMTRLVAVCAVVGALATMLSILATWRLETRMASNAGPETSAASASSTMSGNKAAKIAGASDFKSALVDVWRDDKARRFTIFVFVSMLAYSAQDLILEPFAGIVHGFSPGESTRLAGAQNGGVLIGMVATAIVGTIVGKSRGRFMRLWTVGGCLASAAALALLAIGAAFGGGAPLTINVVALGMANGAFAVAAIGSMMALASVGQQSREGVRMGVWGAAQAIAFGLGGFVGAAAVDVVRAVMGSPEPAFATVFALEAATFAVAAILAVRVGGGVADHVKLPAMPSVEGLAAE